ncbi:MAG: phosphotriesterase-related protein [Chloroflexi bacterium]|nr:phosphotriesterase-related protein [Chloroflexota bacterium]
MYVQTVNGPIAPDQLGVTLSHEHVLIDFRCAWIVPPPQNSKLANAEVTTELVPILRGNPQYSLLNLVLDDEDTATGELKLFKQTGGNALVDMTDIGLGPDPSKLRRISQKSNVHIVAGCGYYRHIAQTPAVLIKDSSELSEEIVKCLQEGIGQTDVRAGIIGEVGTSDPLHPFERESLVAAAKAQNRTGAAINIHPDVWGRGHLEVLNILEAAGADLDRTIMSHMDEVMDPEWHTQVAARGVYLSFDTFGSEFTYDGVEEPKDSDRIRVLISLLEKGYCDRLLISQDICYKISLIRYGGKGYSHVLSGIVPQLKARGVADSELRKMLVENPCRILTI